MCLNVFIIMKKDELLPCRPKDIQVPPRPRNCFCVESSSFQSKLCIFINFFMFCQILLLRTFSCLQNWAYASERRSLAKLLPHCSLIYLTAQISFTQFSEKHQYNPFSQRILNAILHKGGGRNSACPI